MDPFSLALGIAGVLPLVASAISRARKYHESVLNRRRSIANLITELTSLETCLGNLNEFLSSEAIQNRRIVFNDASVLRSCASACTTKLEELSSKLNGAEARMISKLFWPLSESEHEKTVQELRSFTTWMQLALSIDGCSLLARAAEDVMKIMSQQLEQFKAIETIRHQTVALHDAIAAQTQLLEASKRDETRRTILNWISPLKHEQTHSDVRATRAAETGSWILDSMEYQRWYNCATSENVLWCPGIQGSGKTNLV
jgi:hypothetical protein